MTAKTLAELRAQTEAQLAEMRGQISDLRKAGGLNLSRPRELDAKEIVETMQREPGRRMIALVSHPSLGLRAGESFDPRNKFDTPIVAGQYVSAGFKAAIAPV